MDSLDDGRVDVLDRHECLRLLGSVPIGRVAFTRDALPSVQPVMFVLHGDQVVFQTCPGSKLDAALRDAVVAFEADEYDLAGGTGWNVTAVGTASVVTDRTWLRELAALPLRPWGGGAGAHYVRIAIALLDGRRIAGSETAGSTHNDKCGPS